MLSMVAYKTSPTRTPDPTRRRHTFSICCSFLLFFLKKQLSLSLLLFLSLRLYIFERVAHNIQVFVVLLKRAYHRAAVLEVYVFFLAHLPNDLSDSLVKPEMD